MHFSRIQILVNLGLISSDVHSIAWHAQLDQDEADEVFAIEVGTLVWAD